MPLKQTERLISKYGKSLRSNEISDKKLKKLLSVGVFKQSDAYVNPEDPVSDSNHSVTDGMRDFVLAFAPDMDSLLLHKLVGRMIAFSPKEGKGEFFRNASLAKVLLCYVFAVDPENAQAHLEHKRIKTELPKPEEINNFKLVILSKTIAFFSSRLETQYQTAKHRLENLRDGMDNDSNQEIYLSTVIKQADAGVSKDRQLLIKTSKIFDDTYDFLTNRISLDRYENVMKHHNLTSHPETKKLAGTIKALLEYIQEAGISIFPEKQKPSFAIRQDTHQRKFSIFAKDPKDAAATALEQESTDEIPWHDTPWNNRASVSEL